MPIVVGTVYPGIEWYDPRGGRVVSQVKEQQLYATAVPCENTEVHPAVADGGAEGGSAPFVQIGMCRYCFHGSPW